MSRRTAVLRRGGTSVLVIAVLAVVAVVAANSLAYLAFAAFAMVPTVLVAAIERRGHRSATIAVGSMTTATIMPQIFGAIAHGSTRDLLTSLEAWIFVAGAVAGGMAIYLVMPTATVWVDDWRTSTRLREMRRRQAELERLWGPEVKSPVGG